MLPIRSSPLLSNWVSGEGVATITGIFPSLPSSIGLAGVPLLKRMIEVPVIPVSASLAVVSCLIGALATTRMRAQTLRGSFGSRRRKATSPTLIPLYCTGAALGKATDRFVEDDVVVVELALRAGLGQPQAEEQGGTDHDHAEQADQHMVGSGFHLSDSPARRRLGGRRARAARGSIRGPRRRRWRRPVPGYRLPGPSSATARRPGRRWCTGCPGHG